MTALAAITALTAHLALVSSSDVELRWSAPPDCPPTESVRSMLDAHLRPVDPRQRVEATVDVVRVEDGYVAELAMTLGERRSARTLRAARCPALAEAVALVVAVTVEASRASDDAMAEPPVVPIVPELPPPVVTPPPQEATSVMVVPAAEPRAPMPRRAPSIGMHARLFGAVEWGPLPRTSGAPGLAVGMRGRGFRAELSAGGLLPRTTTLEGDDRVRARLSAWSVGARGCGVPARRRLEFPLCVAVEGGALEGAGRGATVNPTRTRRPWFALAAGPGLAFAPLPRLALLVAVDAVVPLWRAQFLIGGREIHRPRPVGVRGVVGFELRLGGAP